MAKIFLTGACGYKGSVLIPKLLAAGHSIRGIDVMWFGNYLDEHPELEIIKGDIRNLEAYSLDGCDCVIHLASIANDPCGNLDPLGTWEISCLGTERLVDKAARAGVSQFIYASSASVYGLKNEEQITEDLELVPISVYNKTKMITERILLSYNQQIKIQIIRPATVCGFSPRMRLDVVVNNLTMQAITRGLVTVFGGSQLRPNIHIDDITDAYCFFVDNPDIVGVFNAGHENLSVLSIAEKIISITGGDIKVEPSNDPRSYKLNSNKLADVGFMPKKTVDDAINEIIDAVNQRKIVNEERCYNVSWMRGLLKGQTSRI